MSVAQFQRKGSASAALKLGPVSAWLERVRARELWSLGNDDDHSITAYSVNGCVCLLHIFVTPAGSGWELYVPSSKRNNVAATLDEAAEYCGVEGCRGLVPGEETD